MSSPATADFLAAWRELDASRRTLAKIETFTPTNDLFYFGTAETITPDNKLWQAGLRCDSIRETVGLLDPGVSPADCSIRLLRPDASQPEGSHVGGLLSQHLFQNAEVTLYFWVEGAGLADVDLFQIYKGKVSRPVDITFDGITLYLLQDMSWNKQTPPTVVDKVSYPNSPDVSQGLPIPIVYGDHRAAALRSPWTAAYTNKSKQEDSGAGAGVVPLVLVDAGIGNAKVKVVAAGHLLADLLDRTNGYSTFMAGNSVLNPMDTTGITESLGASESYEEIADENAIAYAPMIPIDVRASENTATDPRKAMDPNDETSYATLNQATGKNELQLILPNPGSQGRIESVQYYVAWSGNAGNANNLRIRSRTPGVGFGATTANWVSTGTTPAIQTGTWSTSDYSQNWDFGGSSSAVFDVRIDFTGGAANQARIYWVVLVVKFRPERSVVTPGARILASAERARFPGQSQYVGGSRPFVIRHFLDVLPSYKLESQFYANLKGYKDDGSGTFTGSASALLERAPDIARHFMETYGLIADADIEFGSGATGSFLDARDTLRNSGPTDFKLACWIGDRTTVQRALQSIAEQSGMCIYLDRFTDKWLCFVWKPGAQPDYDRTFSWFAGDIADFVCEETSVVDVRHAIRIKYGFDHFKSKTLYEAFLSSAGSGQGLNLPTVRDEKLTVTAGVNDDVDWFAGGALAAVLTAGTYDPIDLAQEVRVRMRAVEADNSKDAGYGFSIKTGYNDLLDFNVGGVAKQVTLNEADYTAEGLATEVARAMNTASGLGGRVFACTYSHSTNKFTVTSTGGNFVVDGTGGAAGIAQAAAHVIGEHPAILPGEAASQTMGFVRYGNRFWFSDGSTAFTFLWGTGASSATNAAWLLGFERADTASSGDHTATYLRGDREDTAVEFEGFYGPREERQVTADWIRNETAAVELRNRIFDLTARPRVVVRFKTYRAPDIRRLQVIQFSSDLDARVPYPKYGTDGSWAGKPFLVLEVEQAAGPQYHGSILAMEAA